MPAKCYACGKLATRKTCIPGGQDGLWITEPSPVDVCSDAACMPWGQFDGQPDWATVLTTLVGGIVQRLVGQR